jgi:hypothetical protein
MKYEYLACGGVNCDKMLDLVGHEYNFKIPPKPPWLTLRIEGKPDFHFCSFQCLSDFTTDKDAPGKSRQASRDHFGYPID